ncbi:hypothetical protein CGRA01v4_14916 [Colletotrichum graminicola]|nr:hypothetical protein CGRA01v4_14916 [Colletotrichum graminicola]
MHSSARHIAKQIATHPETKSIAKQVQRNMASGTPSETAKAQASADANAPSFESIGIKNNDIVQKSGVSLSQQQKVLVGSVLDLFEGNPTLKHLSLWSRNATFQDNITVAEGYDKFAAQWYGLPALFNPIKIQSHTVTSAGNPIELELKNSYTVKGVKTEQTMESVVQIEVGDDGKIVKVNDKWNNNLPDGAFSQVRDSVQVSFLTAARTLAWLASQAGVAVFCRVSQWRVFWALRKLNAVTVPAFVKVPKNEEEDQKLKAEREKQ